MHGIIEILYSIITLAAMASTLSFSNDIDVIHGQQGLGALYYLMLWSAILSLWHVIKT